MLLISHKYVLPAACLGVIVSSCDLCAVDDVEGHFGVNLRALYKLQHQILVQEESTLYI